MVNFDLKNPNVRCYFYNCSLLCLKILALELYTIIKRYRCMVFMNPEDAKFCGGKVSVDDNVERVRRAHLNDLENILIFFVISFIYILTNPSWVWATILFKTYTTARIIHTIVYTIFVLPPPARGFAWATGYLITIYMGLYSVYHFYS